MHGDRGAPAAHRVGHPLEPSPADRQLGAGAFGTVYAAEDEELAELTRPESAVRIGVGLTVWCYYFFRDPERVTPARAGPDSNSPRVGGLSASSSTSEK